MAFLVAVASISFGKGPTTRITIESRHFSKPIEITDPAITKDFQVFTELIVNWAAGPVTPPAGLESYRVSFHIGEYPHPYVVLYAPDPSDNGGYVYVPGKHDAAYATNVAIIYRRSEGKWFRALSRWEDVVRPLVEKGEKLSH